MISLQNSAYFVFQQDDRDMMDTCGFDMTNNVTDCPKITKHDEQFLHSIQFWIGGVVSCCVAITGKNQILRFFFFLQKNLWQNAKVWMVLNCKLSQKFLSMKALIILHKNIGSPIVLMRPKWLETNKTV